MLKSPCKNCRKRITGKTLDSCHTLCPEYNSFREGMDKFNAARHLNSDYEEYLAEACSKNKRRRRV